MAGITISENSLSQNRSLLKKNHSPLFLLGLIFVSFSCHTEKVQIKDFDGPPTIIYKTKKDYSKNVPVMLSSDKSRIVSYPAVSDIGANGNYTYPDILIKNYLLDNRGIGPDVAFLSLTYEEYGRLKEIPPLAELYKMIIDKDPLTEMYNCGNRQQYAKGVEDFNKIIKSGSLQNCRKLR
jgi:hypothetical protein